MLHAVVDSWVAWSAAILDDLLLKLFLLLLEPVLHLLDPAMALVSGHGWFILLLS